MLNYQRVTIQWCNMSTWCNQQAWLIWHLAFGSFRPKSEHNSATRKNLSSGTTSSLWRIFLRQIYRSSNLVPILNPFMICSWDTGKSPRRIRNLVPVILRYVGQKKPECFHRGIDRLRTVWPVTLSMILGEGFLSEVDGHVGYRLITHGLLIRGVFPQYSWFDT